MVHGTQTTLLYDFRYCLTLMYWKYQAYYLKYCDLFVTTSDNDIKIKRKRIPKGQSKIDNQGTLATGRRQTIPKYNKIYVGNLRFLCLCAYSGS
jgi:hypothetical protein